MVHPVLPGEIPSPTPVPHERDASPMLSASSILPSMPVVRVPGPSAGSGSTTNHHHTSVVQMDEGAQSRRSPVGCPPTMTVMGTGRAGVYVPSIACECQSAADANNALI